MTLLDSGSGLNPRVAAAVKERGWTDLTPIQSRAIPYILRGHNVLMIAPTGMGKTEAAILPIFSMMIEESVEPVSVLYLTPMKALINDLYERIKWWADRLGFIVARKHGDVSSSERSRRLRKVPHVLITTPESLEIDLDWAPRFRGYYRNLRWVIIDEVHEFASSKRGAQLALQLERLSALAGRDIQRIGLSATIGDPERALLLISGSSRRPGVVVDEGSKRKSIIKVVYVPEKGEFWETIARVVYNEIEKPSIVFVNSRYMAEKLKQSLETIGATDVFVHHSSVSPEDREEAERRLRQGGLSAIVATKTLELGIDIGEIAKVIQVKSPGRVSSLIQRLGRSGHRLGLPSRGTIVSIGELDAIESAALASLAYEGYVEPVVVKSIPLDVVSRTIQGILLERKEEKIDVIMHIVSSHPLSKISREEFNKLIDYLEENGIVRKTPRGTLRLGSTFFKIWRFRGGRKERTWWTRDFTEFFSLISDREMFQVKHGDRHVGSLDSIFVYRFLRPGDTIRLAGRSWRVKRIDASSGKVEVEPSDEPGDIPLWRGESVRKSQRLALKTLKVISGGLKALSPLLIMGENIPRIIEAWRERFSAAVEAYSADSIIYEIKGDEHVLIGPFGTRVSETLALILMSGLVKEQGLSTYYRVSFLGFSILNKTGKSIVDMLASIEPETVRDMVWKALPRSPLYGQVVREIRLSLGKIGSLGDDEDDLVSEEARRQIIENYLDVEGAALFIRKLREGKLKIIRPRTLTPLAESILLLPPIRPWIPDLPSRIVRALEGYALSVIDLADILEVSDRTVEARLKDMRKPEYGDRRVFCFIDVIDEECKWALAREAEDIALMEDFEDSFRPIRMEEPLRVSIKPYSGGTYREIIVTPLVVEKDWERLRQRLPDEIYMLRVAPAYGPIARELTITYYNVPKDIVRILLMNAASVIQRRISRLY